jgi:amino acid transporter
MNRLALASVELGLAMPSNGGFIIWTKRSFGPGLAFCVSMGSWFNSLVNFNCRFPSFDFFTTIIIIIIN